MAKTFKQLLLASILIVCTFFLVTLWATNAFTFTWEGELNPNEFDKWEVISVQSSPQGFLWMYAKNPDQASPIDIVAMAVDLNSTLFGYRYFKYGQPYFFVYDAEEAAYMQYKFTEEEKQSCMQCHQEQLEKYHKAS